MKGINWRDHIINLLVVILGISIAFYLERWKEDKTNEKLEAKYLKNLQEDLTNDLNQLDTLIRIHEHQLKIIGVLSNASINRPYDKDSLVYYVQFIQYSLPFSPQMTTYESMKFSGKVEIIQDFEFRKRMLELYEQYYRGMRQYDDAVSEHIKNYIQSFSIKRLVYSGRNTLENDFLLENEFRNMIFPYHNLVRMRLEFYRQVFAELEKVLEEIELYMGEN